MEAVSFQLIEEKGLALIQFELRKTVLSPGDLRTCRPPDPVKHAFAQKGVILSGRGPIWLYGFLVHFYHPTRWVAIYDPRLGAAVVVESHHPSREVGDLVDYEPNATS